MLHIYLHLGNYTVYVYTYGTYTFYIYTQRTTPYISTPIGPILYMSTPMEHTIYIFSYELKPYDLHPGTYTIHIYTCIYLLLGNYTLYIYTHGTTPYISTPREPTPSAGHYGMTSFNEEGAVCVTGEHWARTCAKCVHNA